MSNQLSIKGFYEVALPVVDLQESKRFTSCWVMKYLMSKPGVWWS
jgi:hypothetical protein